MENSCEKFLHAINCVPGCEWKILDRLWKKFGNWRYVWEMAAVAELLGVGARPTRTGRPVLTEEDESADAGAQEFVAATVPAWPGVGQNFAYALVESRRKFDVDAEFGRLWERDIAVVSRQHSEYPPALLPLEDAPFLLYRKGAALSLHRRMVSVVGTRNPSTYGKNVAYDLAEAVAAQGVTVVSGLAFGIDAVSHFATVSLRKPTIAVLASGLYDITPSSHHRLAEKILEHGGTIVSEYSPSHPALPYRFLERNRIIAGLSEATVVIEAGERSGALSTARRALDYGRDIYALPGDITRPQARGCLTLIRDGAHPILGVDSFLEQLGFGNRTVGETRGNFGGRANGLGFQLSPEEEKIFSLFEGSPRSTDALMALSGLTIQQMNVLLTELQMKGLIAKNSQYLWERL